MTDDADDDGAASDANILSTIVLCKQTRPPKRKIWSLDLDEMIKSRQSMESSRFSMTRRTLS
jgi:hypothetical protein